MWRYYKEVQGSWHHTFTSYFKVGVGPQGEDVGEPISIDYEEYINKGRVNLF